MNPPLRVLQQLVWYVSMMLVAVWPVLLGLILLGSVLAYQAEQPLRSNLILLLVCLPAVWVFTAFWTALWARMYPERRVVGRWAYAPVKFSWVATVLLTVFFVVTTDGGRVFAAVYGAVNVCLTLFTTLITTMAFNDNWM